MENTLDEIETVQLSKEAELEGFDRQAGETWIYPTNYPTRDYQYNIIQKALLRNTLVSLPTGLGKTFIAAVVMYNIYRWYPHGKIIFMAPTKPLVKQQVDACYNIMAIPPEATAELTGAKASSARASIWTEKRVFFVTPQVLQNDLNKIAELGSKIKCLVFDEAHRAKGNHAYCEVIRRLLAQNHKYFRVLALSATPGSTVNDVLEVIQNLLISHVEFRTEESLDVAPYVFQRSLETVVVPLDKKLEEVKDNYLKVVEPYVKTLIRFNIVQGNCCSLTKGKIFMLMKNFQDKNRGTSSSNYSEIMRCLNICVTLYHALELLIRHGLRNFLSFYDEHIEKPLLRGNTQLRCIINNVREYLGPIPNIEVLPDGTYPEIPKNIKFGHPKYYKLRDVLVSHFSQVEKNTRVMVFFEYRESVMEAHTMLLQSRPLIQPKIFLGQGSGITQKVQLGVVKAFREGRCNTLLSTCIGEEGLDVGEVDLIICFDISNKSPIRMVQRMGRTGRKREGRIVVLVTEGKEQQTLKDCLIHKNNISTYVLESKQLNSGMYPDSPRLVSQNLTPRCEKMFITVKAITKKKSVKDMLKSLSSNSSEPVFSQEVTILNIKERIPKAAMLFNKELAIYEERNIEENPIFYRFIEKQRATQRTHKVKHSKYTKILTDLLCSADSKRFNLPTQVQSLTQGSTGKNLKQGDIRNMFVKKNSRLDFQPTQKRTDVLEDIPTQIIAKEINEHVVGSDDSNIPKEVFTLVSNYLFTQMANPLSKCRHCPLSFHCEDFALSTEPVLLTNNNWVPSEDILDTISITDLENFTKSLDPTYHGSSIQLDQSDFTQMMDIDDSQIFNHVNFTQLEKEAEINSGNIKAETEKSFNFEAPKTYSNLLSKFGNSIFISQETTQVVKGFESNNNENPSEITEKSLLEFFMLESLTDIYSKSSPNSSQSTVIYSQNLSDLDPDENSLCDRFKSPSPILSLSERKRRHSNTRKTGTTQDQVPNGVTDDSTIKRTGTLQNLVTDVNKNDKNLEKQVNSIDINDFCDLSYFGISNSKVEEIDLNKTKVSEIEQICDLSQFGILPDENEEIKDAYISKNVINNDINLDNSNNDIFSQDETFQLSEAHVSNKNILNFSCDNLCEKSSTPREKRYNLPGNLNYQTMTPLNTSPVIHMDQTFVDMDFNLLTQPMEFTKKCDVTGSKLNCTQKSNFIDSYRESELFAAATPNNSKKNILTFRRKNAGILIDQTDFNSPTQHTDFTKKDVNKINGSKLNATQKSNFIDDYEDSDVFAMATQPTNLNRTNIPTRIESDKKIIKQTVVLNLPAQQTDTKQSENLLKLSCTQKSTFIEEYEENQIFAVANQPKGSNKTNILTRNKTLENKDQLDSSAVEEEIENIDLTLSPTPTNEKRILSCESQIPITQMLSLLNKTTQKENVYGKVFHATLTPMAQSPVLNKGINTWMSKLSTKKNTHKTESSIINMQSKIVSKKETDPYLFSKNFKSTRQHTVDKGSTSSDEFEDSVFLKPEVLSVKPIKKFLDKKRKVKNRQYKKKTNDFLDIEAQLSEDENFIISEDEDEENIDFYEKSFVNDETQNLDTQMHAKYLQSVRSPARPGRFKIPIRPAINISDVYSQPYSTEEDTYLEDSFCVDTDDNELTQQDELSQLEILEKKLREKKKRKKSDEKEVSKPKRRRVICFASDDSD